MPASSSSLALALRTFAASLVQLASRSATTDSSPAPDWLALPIVLADARRGCAVESGPTRDGRPAYPPPFGSVTLKPDVTSCGECVRARRNIGRDALLPQVCLGRGEGRLITPDDPVFWFLKPGKHERINRSSDGTRSCEATRSTNRALAPSGDSAWSCTGGCRAFRRGYLKTREGYTPINSSLSGFPDAPSVCDLDRRPRQQAAAVRNTILRRW